MSTEERIERFNEENAPFYLVDHGNEYSLCFLLGGTPTAAAEYGQYAFDHYAETVGKPVEENGWLTYGDGYDWECVFKEAFEDDPAFHKVYFDCESSGFFCISEDLSVLESFGSSFKSLVENREEFTRLVESAMRKSDAEKQTALRETQTDEERNMKILVGFLREQFQIGSRVQVKETENPHLKTGTEGLLKEIDDAGQFHIQLQSGAIEKLKIGVDRFSVLPPPTHELKLYMPLTADLYERNRWGDMEDEPTELTGWDLRHYEDQISAALLRERMPEEAERGIMHWYAEGDAVDQKVKSAVFTAEDRKGQLWGVVECQVAGELSPEELDTLKEYISGQASDGWGEGFEQREIKLDLGQELYVHLWNSSDRWSIRTEEECFGPKFAPGLPEMCFSVLPGSGELICIKRGESGYYRSDWSTSSREQNEELANYNNERLGVSNAQRRAMETGSMYGWQVPGADPANNMDEETMGGMNLG